MDSPVDFKYQLTQTVYFMQNKMPVRARLIKRYYAETWHDPERENPDSRGGYTTGKYYETNGSGISHTFSEQDFGRIVFTDPTEFIEKITSQ